jgi:hypothetical protein
MTKLIASNKD